MNTGQRRKSGRYEADLIKTPLGDMTRVQAAACFGLQINTLHGRLYQGWEAPKLFDPPKVPPKPRQSRPNRLRKHPEWLTPWGWETAFSAAKRLGMHTTAMQGRLYGKQHSKGKHTPQWTPEEAFNTPAHGKRGVQFIIPPDEYRRRMEQMRAKEDATV